MTFRDLKEQLTNLTSQSDPDRLNLAINLAVSELWHYIDLPDAVAYDFFNAEDGSIVTFPPEVYMLRAVKPSNLPRREIEHHVNVMRSTDYWNNSWLWELMGVSALARTIKRAGKIRFSVQSAESENVDISIAGRTPTSARYATKVTLEAGSLEVYTEVPFMNVGAITKPVTQSDVRVHVATDLDDPIAVIPNYLSNSVHHVVKMRPCGATSCSSCSCFEVAYLLPPPRAEFDDMGIASPFDQALLMKAVDNVHLIDDGGKAAAGQKAAALLATVMRSFTKGLRNKIPQQDTLIDSASTAGLI